MSVNYSALRDITDPVMAKRCSERLVVMRQSLASLRENRRDSSFLLATWNLRDFGADKFGFGPRLEESYLYIAEIMSCFDLIAVQEVNRNLYALRLLMKALGDDWDYITTDATEGTGGNGERMAFIFNRDKVEFLKVAGEIVLPGGQLVVPPKKVIKPAAQTPKDKVDSSEGQQFARTPFLVAFQSGWFHFNLCTVHIYYGEESGPPLDRRIGEIERLVEFFADRQNAENKKLEESSRNATGIWPGPQEYENYILLGDFNVVSPEHKTMAALRSKGFTIPEQIDGAKLPIEQRHTFFDQIAVRVKDPRFEVRAGGTVDIFKDVFREEDFDLYKASLPKKDPEPGAKKTTPEALYKKWRTWQLSDHWPLWVEINTDFSEDFLEQFADMVD